MKFAFVLVFFLFKKKTLSCYAVVNLLNICAMRKSFQSAQCVLTIRLLRNRMLHIFASCVSSNNSWILVSWACSPKLPFRVVGSNGLGPSTSRLSGVCSNQLSYEPISFSFLRRCGGGNRVRTDDPLLAGQVLYQLSYAPIPLKKMPPRKASPLSIKNE